MNLLRKWRKPEHQSTGKGMVIHGRNSASRGGLARPRDFRQQIDNVFNAAWSQFDDYPWSTLCMTLPDRFGSLSDWPAADIAEDEKAVTFRFDLPGLEEKNLKIEVSGNLLTVRGSREREWNDHQHDVRRRERISGSFARTVALPTYVDAQNAEARYDKGTLTISVPKLPGKGPKRVQVTAQ